ncbi:MAG: hypothetical protein LBE24_07250, partial [Methylobacillus sp.]|nr:hypothetical protein [Methylobacillus sp.]
MVTTIEEAKIYAVNVTSGKLTSAQVSVRLESFKKYKENAIGAEEKQDWQRQIDELQIWANSETFTSGDFPQGIDTLVFDLIEWRAMIYAFTQANTKDNPFHKFPFFSQWLVGATYAVFSIIGKLNSHYPDDTSLRKVWGKIRPFIEQDGVRLIDEIHYIDECLSNRLTKSRSKALQFRHKVIAHNEKNLNLSWDDIDPDIQMLVRIWALIVSWCSYGVLPPFYRSKDIFAGLESYYDQEDMAVLHAKRDEYIERTKTWCKTYLHNGQP